MTLNVEVRVLGTFQKIFGKQSLKLKLEEPATVRDVIHKLIAEYSEEFKGTLVDSQLDPPHNSLILVGGKEISSLQGLETEVKNTEEIVLIPIVHGG